MKLQGFKPVKINANVLTFVRDENQEYNSSHIKNIFPKDISPIYSVYSAKEEIEWLGDIKIPKGRIGNTGPYNDMVYFIAGDGQPGKGNYMIAIMIEVLLYHYDLFEPSGEKIGETRLI